jgi:uncharacterized NAD(P)/FAD-binding protein YdhS
MNQTRPDGEILNTTVAVIGGGFTGATLAAQLLRNSREGLSVVLIDRCTQIGLGVAYGTRCWGHLLNVRVKNMSAYPDDLDHFHDWARINHDLAVSPGDYLPRAIYGRYIVSLLEKEIERHPNRFEHVLGEAISLARTGDTAEIHLRSGRILFADRVVLALGNFPPGDPRLPGRTAQCRRYISNPWAASAMDGLEKAGIEHAQSVLLVGSGLTSVDVALSLQTQGFSGTIHILSRRGLLPLTHKATAHWPAFWDEESPRTVSGLMRLIRAQAEAADDAGSGWRAVMDSLRPVIQQIWQSLPLKEQRRFLRHARPYWDVHRHRVAPAIGAWLADQLQGGKISTHAGRITEYAEAPDGVDVSYRDRQTGALEHLRVDRVINCTGPECDCRKVDSPLLASLLRQKLARHDALFLGLDVAPDGALIDAQGVASDLFFAVGPIRKGNLWESTAVPDLRIQVAEVSKVLLNASKAQEAKLKGREAFATLQSLLSENIGLSVRQPGLAGFSGGDYLGPDGI